MLEQKLPLDVVPFVQARLLARTVRSEMAGSLPYLPKIGFVRRMVVTFDVSTETAAGRKRLRRVAKVREGSDQRVQKSVFECQVDDMQLEELERRLLAEIDEATDHLRFYRITESAHVRVKQYGSFHSTDFEGPLDL